MNEGNSDRERDPLGLGGLPLLEPPGDGWPDVRDRLLDERRTRRRRRLGAWAAAASVVIAVIFVSLRSLPPPGAGPESGIAAAPAPAGDTAEDPAAAATVEDLVTLSQVLEQRLRRLRAQTGAVAGETAVYIAELEDMIARVDGALSGQPDSVDLWGQRVNLMLDLELIYQHHWEREYGRMAAL